MAKPKQSKLRKQVKKLAFYGAATYLASFAAVNLHIGYDFFKYNSGRIERGENPTQLEVRKYKVNINGHEEDLTLVGEYHLYNKKENLIGQDLVSQHQNFAYEGGGNKDLTLGNSILLYSTATAMIPSFLYFILGSGRTYDSIYEILEKKGKTIHPLENSNDAWNNFSMWKKSAWLCSSVVSLFTAPLSYYAGRYEKPFEENHSSIGIYKEELLDKRDKVMAQNLVQLMKRDDIDGLMACVGRAHVNGIVSNLSQITEIQEVK